MTPTVRTLGRLLFRVALTVTSYDGSSIWRMGSSFYCSWGTSSTKRPWFSGGLILFVDNKKGERFWWSYIWEIEFYFGSVYFLECLLLIFCIWIRIWICDLFYGHMFCVVCILFYVLRLAWASVHVWTYFWYGIYVSLFVFICMVYVVYVLCFWLLYYPPIYHLWLEVIRTVGG